MSLVLGFHDAGATESGIVGGKAASLGRMVALGFNVPPGFSVCTQAHSEFLSNGGVALRIRELLVGIDVNDAAELEARTSRIRALIEAAELPPAIILRHPHGVWSVRE